MFCSEKYWSVLPRGVVATRKVAAEHVQCLVTGFGINARLLQPVSVAFSKPPSKENVALPKPESTPNAEPKELK